MKRYKLPNNTILTNCEPEQIYGYLNLDCGDSIIINIFRDCVTVYDYNDEANGGEIHSLEFPFRK